MLEPKYVEYNFPYRKPCIIYSADVEFNGEGDALIILYQVCIGFHVISPQFLLQISGPAIICFLYSLFLAGLLNDNLHVSSLPTFRLRFVSNRRSSTLTRPNYTYLGSITRMNRGMLSEGRASGLYYCHLNISPSEEETNRQGKACLVMQFEEF